MSQSESLISRIFPQLMIMATRLLLIGAGVGIYQYKIARTDTVTATGGSVLVKPDPKDGGFFLQTDHPEIGMIAAGAVLQIVGFYGITKKRSRRTSRPPPHCGTTLRELDKLP